MNVSNMGVKTRRIPPVDLIHKGGRMYARRGGQNHRVCECRVFYMNCIKCNEKYATRKSDYMTMMVKHARETSLKRQVARPGEDHEFDEVKYYKMLLTRIKESRMQCECTLCMSLGIRQTLSIRGPNKMSMDRVRDDLGYTHRDQVLRIISKAHHSPQKRDATPVEVGSKRKWANSTLSGIIRRSRKRYERTRKEITQMESAMMDVSDMSEFLKTHIVDRESTRSMIERMRNDTPRCLKCGIDLYYGNEDGYLLFKNNPRQASPDRINDRMGYTPENVQMVCCACQTLGEVDDADDIFLDKDGLIDLEIYMVNKIGSLEDVKKITK